MIWNLWESKGYGAWRLIRDFFYKNWKRRGIKKLSRKVHKTGLLDHLTGSAWQTTHIPQLCGATWYSWPMTSILVSLCLSQRRTFWTYVVTVNLFPLCLMNFMFHTMLDKAGIVGRVHYISMKCDVLFSQGSIRTLFRRGGHFSYMSKKFLPLYNRAKIIKIDQACD